MLVKVLVDQKALKNNFEKICVSYKIVHKIMSNFSIPVYY